MLIWGQSSDGEQEKLNGLQHLSYTTSCRNVFPGLKVQIKAKALGAWGLEPEGLTAEMHSVLFKSPSSPTVNSGILAYLLSKTLKAGLKNIWTVLATMQGACGQQGVGEKAPP